MLPRRDRCRAVNRRLGCGGAAGPQPARRRRQGRPGASVPRWPRSSSCTGPAVGRAYGLRFADSSTSAAPSGRWPSPSSPRRRSSSPAAGDIPIIVAFVLVLGGPLGEELGWRGVLQPRLEAQLGSLRATLLTGIVWAARHLPCSHSAARCSSRSRQRRAPAAAATRRADPATADDRARRARGDGGGARHEPHVSRSTRRAASTGRIRQPAPSGTHHISPPAAPSGDIPPPDPAVIGSGPTSPGRGAGPAWSSVVDRPSVSRTSVPAAGVRVARGSDVSRKE